MPGGPGESLVTTLFADVHYYLSDPSSKPPHHRFSKGSYLYIYHNATTHHAKLEVANHAGTPEQDAFSGSLNLVRVEYSYKHPTRFTFQTDAFIQDQQQWHLPAYDPRNEQMYLYKLHSLDVYLWTEKDASTLVRHLQSIMAPSRLDLRDVPFSSAPSSGTLAEHRDSMSPVVRQLEQTAIGTHFPPRAESVVSSQSYGGPPTPASPPIASPQPKASAYNPAAPPAPEPIAYREKTPPPPEDGMGNGSTQYAGVPSGYQQNSNQVTPQHAYFGGPPQPETSGFSDPTSQTSASPPDGLRSFSGGPPPILTGGPSPNPYAQQQQPFAPSFGLPPTSPPPHQQNFQPQPSYTGLPTQPQFATYAHQQFATHPALATPSFGPYAPSTPGIMPPTPSAPPAYAGHTPLQSPGLPLPPPPPGASQQQQQQQVAGYSNYIYAAQTPAQAQAAQQQLNQHGAYTGDMHHQLYRPTEGEAAHGHGASANSRPQTGRGTTSERVEKRVGGFLKRLDKLI
ncbi:hypothetical protein LTR02_006112 [Friedmanniomyces endolithicus]|nr:hypothetical protein LTR03_004189 [Friedmanniomyces endolithicus]KAK0856935.1 hypothetical protein LTS02_010379 [Friedmanniomyces endolithicus]KAK0879485.1 hypothetical protein LTR87_006724 [Friedmanniomyces endolithicus]KAK0906084.1 hypothetical protein LTR02_006112 [Friedmanniomyces endolithicus]KAK0918518.1 hypothetical protein LTR57_011654 [Friedmanniomyces endolithicus]